MSKYQGGMIGSVANATSGTAYTGRANGVFPLPQQIVAKSSSLWAIGQTRPNPPTIGTARGTDATTVSVAFIAPVQNGGSAITSYTVTSSGGQTATGSSSPIVVSGLTTGTSYTFTVTATNIVGTSLQSEVGTPVTPTAVGVHIVGNVYDITSIGAVTSITDLEEFSPDLPAEGFIKYTILRSGAAGSNITIVTKFKKNGTQLCQSAFMLGDASNFTISAPTSILFYNNDDHDTLLMQGDGTGVIAAINNNTFPATNQSAYNVYDRFRGTTELQRNQTANTVFQYSPGSLIDAASAAAGGSSSLNLISFPKTNTNVWIDNTRQKYKVNDFPEQQLPAAYVAAIGPSSPANSLFTISDGVNCFMVTRHDTANAVYVEINLNNGTFYKYNTYPLISSSQSNNTEEDAEGNQLFAVDASSSFLKIGVFYWGGTGWRWDTSPLVGTNRNATTSLGLSTQSGMDIFGSIDANDGFVWFADWGHDNGGLFNVGGDTQLGVAKTSIKLIDN